MSGKEMRHGCHHAAPVRPCQAKTILPDYDRATLYAGLLIGVSFGVMFAIGVMLGW